MLLMKRLHIVFALLVAMLACGCTSDSFKVDGQLAGLDNNRIRIVYRGADGITDNFYNCIDGTFKFKGHAPELTFVTILDSHDKVITTFLVSNGDVIKLRGDLTDRAAITIEGNDVTEQWRAFRQEHAELYKGKKSELNKAIEDYVKKHNDQLASTVLLLCDYECDGNTKQLQQLIMSIKPDARPQYLIDSYDNMSANWPSESTERIMALNMVNEKGEFEIIRPQEGKALVLMFWDDITPQRDRYFAYLSELKRKQADIVIAADIALTADTTAWQTMLPSTPPPLSTHYWAAGGITDPTLMALHIHNTPLYVVCNGTGNMLYSGNDTTQVTAAIAKMTR